MGLERLDAVFRGAALAVEIFVERLARTLGEVGDDEAALGAAGSGLDVGDDPLDPGPGLAPS